MKANEVPEKLYLSKNIYGTYIYQVPDPDDETVIEYVRTDAFIEKVISFIRNCTSYDGLGYKAKCVNIEDFKKYMKGE